MSQPQNPNFPLLCQENPWKSNENLIWLGSTINLTRNIEKFNFPSKLSTEKKQQMLPFLSQDLLNTSLLKKPKLIKAEEMGPIEKEFLLEHFLSSQSFHQTSVGEAFLLDETGEFLAVLNLDNHLMLEKMDVKEELESAWDYLVQIETHLSKSLGFAFSPQFGFLTADPTECGTALSVSLFLHLPALIHLNQLEEILQKNHEDSIIQTGLQGDPHEIIGDILALHNNYTLGLTEENILSSLRTLATKLVAEEKSARTNLKQTQTTDSDFFKDKISRAFGILVHSYQIEAIEALQALSLLKLGLDLNWVQGTTQSVLNELLFSCRRAHLLCHLGQKIEQQELSHKRAEFIHQQLQGTTLLI